MNQSKIPNRILTNILEFISCLLTSHVSGVNFLQSNLLQCLNLVMQKNEKYEILKNTAKCYVSLIDTGIDFK